MKESSELSLEDVQRFVREWVESVVHLRPGDPSDDAAFIARKVDEYIERRVTGEDLRAIMMRFSLQVVDGLQPSAEDSRAVAHLLLEFAALAHFGHKPDRAFKRRGFALRKGRSAVVDPIRAIYGSNLGTDRQVFEEVMAYAWNLEFAEDREEEVECERHCVRRIKEIRNHVTKKQVRVWIQEMLPEARQRIRAGYFGQQPGP